MPAAQKVRYAVVGLGYLAQGDDAAGRRRQFESHRTVTVDQEKAQQLDRADLARTYAYEKFAQVLRSISMPFNWQLPAGSRAVCNPSARCRKILEARCARTACRGDTHVGGITRDRRHHPYIRIGR